MACVPYMYNYVYLPSSTGQCWLSHPDLIFYLVVLWLALVLLYVILSYIFLAIYIYVNSIRDKTRRKQVITLAMSPLIYLVSFLWIVIARLAQLSTGRTDINLLRASVAISITIGFLSALWFGISRKIYKETYEKLFLNKSASSTQDEGSKKTGTGEENAVAIKTSIP